jgi:hypothetical protein
MTEIYFLDPVNMLQGKRDFAVVIKVKILRQEHYVGLSEWAQYNHKAPYKMQEEDKKVTVKSNLRMISI